MSASPRPPRPQRAGAAGSSVSVRHLSCSARIRAAFNADADLADPGGDRIAVNDVALICSPARARRWPVLHDTTGIANHLALLTTIARLAA
jgi:hypothetical protein